MDLAAGGPLAVTLRGAARRAEVSQTAPYRHFPDKQALLAAIAEQGFRALAHTTRRAIAGIRSNACRLPALSTCVSRLATRPATA